jgi:hypothetical protein
MGEETVTLIARFKVDSFEPRQVAGLESDPGTWFGHIVPGTGTGGFTGWSGSARIVHDDQGAYFEIDLAGS